MARTPLTNYLLGLLRRVNAGEVTAIFVIEDAQDIQPHILGDPSPLRVLQYLEALREEVSPSDE